MTPAVRRTLEIIVEAGPEGIRPGRFAERYFPKDHPGWERMVRCGPKGVHAGGGMTLWAAGWLGQLRKKGLVGQTYNTRRGQSGWIGYVITLEGRNALVAAAQ